MPLYEFSCQCGAVFEELLKERRKYCMCKVCGRTAEIKVSKASLAGIRQEGTVISPVELDKRIGDMSDRRWKSIEDFKQKQGKAQNELGTMQLTKTAEKFVPMEKEKIELHRKVEKIMKEGTPQKQNVRVVKAKS